MGADSRLISKQIITVSDGLTAENINMGSLQRIADATEKMAQSYSEVIAERDNYLRWYKEERARAEKYSKSISALRGVIAKLKKKIH